MAQINPDLDTLRTMAFEQSLVPDVGNTLVDQAFGNRAVNRAIQQVCHDFPALEMMDTIVTVDGTPFYATNADFLRLKAIFKLTVDETNQKILVPLEYPAVESWYETGGGRKGVDPPFNERDKPRYPWVFHKQLFFYQVPTQADSFIVSYYAADTILTAGTSETSVLQEYRGAIIDLASVFICARKGDFTRSQYYQQRYDAQLGVSVQVREPEKKK